nr:MAG TPA: Photosystem II protein D1 1 II, Time resolved, Free [Caudoviricetes sp.]
MEVSYLPFSILLLIIQFIKSFIYVLYYQYIQWI